jgi:hypothetical protein
MGDNLLTVDNNTGHIYTVLILTSKHHIVSHYSLPKRKTKRAT